MGIFNILGDGVDGSVRGLVKGTGRGTMSGGTWGFAIPAAIGTACTLGVVGALAMMSAPGAVLLLAGVVGVTATLGASVFGGAMGGVSGATVGATAGTVHGAGTRIAKGIESRDPQVQHQRAMEIAAAQGNMDAARMQATQAMQGTGDMPAIQAQQEGYMPPPGAGYAPQVRAR